MAEVLTWVMQRRIVLAERAERLRKELVEIDVEVLRLEAAERGRHQLLDQSINLPGRDPLGLDEEQLARLGLTWAS